MENYKVLVTGATGFLGNAVCHNLEDDDRYTLIPKEQCLYIFVLG